ncbi:L,D-transpeptidase family protein [Candidatus Symbiobacter mobilis]|nr:L,D-transpeptidase [Candidatus Symbiobacter mobilis]
MQPPNWAYGWFSQALLGSPGFWGVVRRSAYRVGFCLFLAALILAMGAADAQSKQRAPKPKPSSVQPAAAVSSSPMGAESRLLDIYRLILLGDTRTALLYATALVRDYPHFALAQLVYGDLLQARSRPMQQFGDALPPQRKAGQDALADLREEARLRSKAANERPRLMRVPSQFVHLAPEIRHAIAIDASRARLYVLENRASGMVVVANYYVTIGKMGLGKTSEGDQRTPTGVYFITGRIPSQALREEYGAGALPLNYPNPIDQRRGKTGSGIWLHGPSPKQFARAPEASDGCIVLSNPDLEQLMRTVEPRLTPVVIAPRLHWVHPRSLQSNRQDFEARLRAWSQARSHSDPEALRAFYEAVSIGPKIAPAVDADGIAPATTRQTDKLLPRAPRALSLLRWVDPEETMIVTLEEPSAKDSIFRRQYWARQGRQWFIIHESIVD